MSRDYIKLRIKDVMKEKNMTCTEIAHVTNKKIQYINGVINGGKPMSLNSLALVAEALGVEFGDLFERSSQSKKAETELFNLFYREVAFPSDGSYIFGARVLESIHNSLSDAEWENFMGRNRANIHIIDYISKCLPHLSDTLKEAILKP